MERANTPLEGPPREALSRRPTLLESIKEAITYPPAMEYIIGECELHLSTDRDPISERNSIRKKVAAQENENGEAYREDASPVQEGPEVGLDTHPQFEDYERNQVDKVIQASKKKECRQETDREVVEWAWPGTIAMTQDQDVRERGPEEEIEGDSIPPRNTHRVLTSSSLELPRVQPTCSPEDSPPESSTTTAATERIEEDIRDRITAPTKLPRSRTRRATPASSRAQSGYTPLVGETPSTVGPRPEARFRAQL